MLTLEDRLILPREGVLGEGGRGAVPSASLLVAAGTSGGIDPLPIPSLHASRSTMALCFYAVTEVLILSGQLQVPRSPLGEGAALEAQGDTWHSGARMAPRRRMVWHRM